MNRVFMIAGCGIVALLAIAVGIVIAQADYTYQHPTGEALVVGENGKGVFPQHIVAAKEQLQKAKEAGLSPRLAIDETEHDFGVLNPLTTAKHSFVFRNEGDGPLQLSKGSTSCKCTLSKVSNGGIIAPGEEGEVTLTWNTGRDRLEYEHGAIILTNDPDQPRIELKIRGAVKMTLGTSREALVFPSLEPDKSTSLTTVLFTQLYSDMTVDKASCTIEGVTWKLQPADQQQIDELEATAAQSLTVTVPGDLPSGKFSGVLRLDVSARSTDAPPEAEPDRRILELPISGQVMRRLSLYGDGISQDGTIDFGVINEGESMTRALLMKVRDSQHEIPVKGVDVRPDFVKVSITPHGSGEAPGLYRLVLEVPPDAPQCVYMRKSKGELRIEFDHPRIKELLLKLDLAVAPVGF